MAIFGWKKSTDTSKDGAAAGGGAGGAGTGGVGSGGTGAGGFEFSPEKARRWFDHARVSHEAGNYEYAMTCWLSGLRFDPGNLESVKAFTASARMYTDGNKKASSRELQKAIIGKTDVDKYLTALLEWACKPIDPEYAVAAAAASAMIGLSTVTQWMLPTTLKVIGSDPKPRKANFVKLMEIAEKQEQFDIAVTAGDTAVRLDPADNKLSAYVRNLSAQSSISRGGFDKTGEEGGFRQNIRNADKQRMINEAERTGKTESGMAGLMAVTRAEYDANPLDKPTIKKYANLLLERRAAGDEDVAHAVLLKAHTATNEFGFREAAGEIKLRQGRRALKAIQVTMDAGAGDEAAKANFAGAYRAQLELEAAEYYERARAYPTNLSIKLELGKRQFELGQYQEAIDQFQQAKADQKLRAPALHALGLAFQAIEWHDEAIDTFRLGLEGASELGELAGLDLKYGLMVSLQKRADEMKDVPSAEEALKLASNIALQQINFKDIRARRESIKALVIRLKG